MPKIEANDHFSEQEGNEASQGSGAANQMVAGALAGEHFRGGGRGSMAAERNRGREKKRRAPPGAVSHQEHVERVGRARRGGNRRRQARTAGGRARRRRDGGGD